MGTVFKVLLAVFISTVLIENSYSGAVIATPMARGDRLRFRELKRRYTTQTPLEKSSYRALCKFVLESNLPSLDSFAVQGAPGLRLLTDGARSEGLTPESSYDEIYASVDHGRKRPAFHPHELESSRKYAKFSLRKSGETVLLAPMIGGAEISGFDGVILDRFEMPAANFSLKTTASARINAVVREAITKVIVYSNPEAWLKEFVKSQDPSQERIQLLHGIFELFGISKEWTRPTRIIVDASASLADLRDPEVLDVKSIRERIRSSEHLIESVVIFAGSKIIEIK